MGGDVVEGHGGEYRGVGEGDGGWEGEGGR